MNTDKWTAAIDETTLAFRQCFGGLSAEALNWKPNAETWSIAQNMDHLIVINESYYPVIQAVREERYKVPFIGKLGFLVRFLGKFILNSVNPDRRNKMKTFPIWEPHASDLGGNILERFADHQESLKHLIADSQDLIDRATVICSPANKNIVYTLDTAFDIIVTHEKRHLEQAKEVLTLMKP